MRSLKSVSFRKITVAPQIAPFTFGGEAANAGDMATVQCAVIKGDIPVEIIWSLNGLPIVVSSDPDDPHHRDIVIRRSGKRASTLTIDSVAARHAGIYSCSASNSAGSAEHAADLSVNGTPIFPAIMEQKDDFYSFAETRAKHHFA